MKLKQLQWAVHACAVKARCSWEKALQKNILPYLFSGNYFFIVCSNTCYR